MFDSNNSFLQSFFAWLILIFIITIIIFLIFYWILGRSDPKEKQEEQIILDQEQELRIRRKWIGLFTLAAIIAIMTTSGINQLLKSN